MRNTRTALLLLTAVLIIGCASSPAVSPSEFVFEHVVDTGVGADEGYGLGLKWFGSRYASAQDVIQATDPDLHFIVGRARMGVPIGRGTAEWDYTITLETRDGRALLSFENWEPRTAMRVFPVTHYTEEAHEVLADYCEQMVADYLATVAEYEGATW